MSDSHTAVQHIHTQMHAHTQAHVYTYTHMNTHAQMHMHTRTCTVLTHAHTHVHMHKAHIHTCTHTHNAHTRVERRASLCHAGRPSMISLMLCYSLVCVFLSLSGAGLAPRGDFRPAAGPRGWDPDAAWRPGREGEGDTRACARRAGRSPSPAAPRTARPPRASRPPRRRGC